MDEKVPKWALKFMEYTCASCYLDELQGDMFELYARDKKELGVKKARRKFGQKALMSLRWYRLPLFRGLSQNNMLQNHLKVAIRHSLKHKSASIIHILGLMFGILVCLFITLFTKNELAYDNMHSNAADIYRVLQFDSATGNRGLSTSSKHGRALSETFPFAEVCSFGNDPVKIGDVNPLMVNDFYWADSTFFDIFTFEVLHGDPNSCLAQRNSIVLTRSMSERLFGTDNSLGEILDVKVYDADKTFQMQVTAVVEDPAQNTHLQFEALGSMANAELLYKSLMSQWGFSWLRTYVYIPNHDISEIENGIPRLVKNNFTEEEGKNFGMAFQAFQDIYLHSQDLPKNTLVGNFRNLYIFNAIGILILLISIFNYINLASARAVTRGKEVGVRKVLGSSNLPIFSQFLVESLVLTLVAGLMAIALLYFLLPFFNAIFDMQLSLQVLTVSDGFVLFLSLLAFGILIGVIPALAIVKFPSIGRTASEISFSSNNWSRNIFIGFQYLVSLLLITATIVIYKQYNFMKNYDLGFDSDQLLHIAVDDRQLQEKISIFKQRIIQLSGVKGATCTGENMPSKLNNRWSMNWSGSELENGMGVNIVGVDKDYFQVMGIEFVDGENFIHSFAVDSSRSVVLNESAANLTGIQNMIGRPLSIGGRDRTVIGVVKNHHNLSLHSETGPLAYFIFPPGSRVSADNVMIKIESKEYTTVLSSIEKIWEEFSPDPMIYNFVDDAFAQAYNNERRFSVLITSFASIAVIISLIALFGMISFITRLKEKELSVRRVLGAGGFDIMQILGRDFLTVYLITLLIAIPISAVILSKWLENYAYHIQLNASSFLMATFLCFFISIFVIVYHWNQINRMDPGKILGRE